MDRSDIAFIAFVVLLAGVGFALSVFTRIPGHTIGFILCLIGLPIGAVVLAYFDDSNNQSK